MSLVAPVGVLLGIPFSASLRRLEHDALVAWAWALNSVLSVAGSVLALILSSALGFSAAALVAVCAYLAAYAALRARSRVHHEKVQAAGVIP